MVCSHKSSCSRNVLSPQPNLPDKKSSTFYNVPINFKTILAVFGNFGKVKKKGKMAAVGK